MEVAMSEKQWDYFEVVNCLKNIAEDTDVIKRWPQLSKVLYDLAINLSDIIDSMDQDLSGDNPILDYKKFQLRSLGALLDPVLKAMPDELFDRGKWGTIQAWQHKTDYNPDD
jgi:hypothetical protein